MTYLFIAYTVMWLGVFGYVVNLFQQSRRLQRQLTTLETTFQSMQKRWEPERSSPVEGGN